MYFRELFSEDRNQCDNWIITSLQENVKKKVDSEILSSLNVYLDRIKEKLYANFHVGEILHISLRYIIENVKVDIGVGT